MEGLACTRKSIKYHVDFPNVMSKTSNSCCASLIGLSMFSANWFSSGANLILWVVLSAGAGAGEFVTPDHGPKPCADEPFLAIESTEILEIMWMCLLHNPSLLQVHQFEAHAFR